MPIDFKTATDSLFAKIGAEDLADAMKCSEQSIKQARMGGDTQGRRAPPLGWEAAVLRLAKQRAAHFQRLADRLGTGL